MLCKLKMVSDQNLLARCGVGRRPGFGERAKELDLVNFPWKDDEMARTSLSTVRRRIARSRRLHELREVATPVAPTLNRLNGLWGDWGLWLRSRVAVGG